MSRISSEAARLSEKHDWDKNDSNYQETQANMHLLWQVLSDICFKLWVLSSSHIEDGVDHEINN